MGRNYRGVMNTNMQLFKQLFHRHCFNKVDYKSNVIQYDSMGYPLRLYITKCDCGMTNQEWIDVPENSVIDKDVVLEWERL